MLFCPNCQQLESTVSQRNSDGTSVFICKKCGGVIPLRRDLRPGEVVAGFEIECELGRGAMGIVYQARQTNLDREVAIKILSDDSASDEVYVERFFREARAAASLSHPNVVQAYDAGVTSDGIYYFVMEKVTGENLELVLNNVGPLNIPQALEVFLSVANALSYAWSRNQLSHGDIKPENIIMRLNGKVKLADFGLARRAKDPDLADEDIRATPAYAPPEIIQGIPDIPGFKSDMYSFGATAYHILIGHEPFVGTDPVKVCAMQVSDIQTPLVELNPNIPRKLSDLVDALMEKDPWKRPASWNDVIKELHAVRAQLAAQPPPAQQHVPENIPDELPNDDESGSRSNNLFRTILVLVTALLLILSGIAVFFFGIMTDSGKSSSGGKASPAADNNRGTPEARGGVAPVRDKAFYRVKWNELQKSFNGSTLDLKVVGDFIKEAGTLAPDEAVKMFQRLQDEQADEETKQTRALVLRNELLDMADSFDWDEAKKKAFGQLDELIEDIRSKQSDLSRLDAALTEKIYLPEQKEKINSFLKELADLQMLRSLGGDDASAGKDAQVSDKTGEVSPEEDGENENVKTDPVLLSAYKLMLGNLPKAVKSGQDRASAIRTLNALLSDKSFADKEARQNCTDIRRFLLLNQASILTFLTNNKSTLRGMKLFPASYPDSVLEDISDSTFFLKTSERANYTVKVEWTRLRRDEGEDRLVVTLINSSYLAKVSEDFREYLYARAIFLGVDQERLRNRYERASGLPARKLKDLSRIAGFFQAVDDDLDELDD